MERRPKRMQRRDREERRAEAERLHGEESEEEAKMMVEKKRQR